MTIIDYKIMNTFVVTPLLLFILTIVYQLLIKNWWLERKILSLSFSDSYKKILEEYFHPYIYLSDLQKENLHYKILYFLHYKHFWAIGDFVIEEKMKILIAAQACLLILKEKSPRAYPQLYNIYISEAAFIEKENDIDLRTLLPQHQVRLGESWMHGPLVLSWRDVEEGLENWRGGHNVVYHEFTHQLDSMDDGMDGTPILKKKSDYKAWQIVMSKNFVELRRRTRLHLKADIDKYGATNEAEFFAVTVEEFFASPRSFHQRHPDMYQLYQSYFELNPLAWHN